MVVGGEIHSAEAQQRHRTEPGGHGVAGVWCMCVDEPGKEGRGQVAGAWRVQLGVWIMSSVLGEAFRGVCGLAQEWG